MRPGPENRINSGRISVNYRILRHWWNVRSPLNRKPMEEPFCGSVSAYRRAIKFSRTTLETPSLLNFTTEFHFKFRHDRPGTRAHFDFDLFFLFFFFFLNFHCTYCSIFMGIYGDFNFIAVDCRLVLIASILLIVRDGFSLHVLLDIYGYLWRF